MTSPIPTCPACSRQHPDRPCLCGVLLVFGGRSYDHWTRLCETLDRIAGRMVIHALRHGKARGADALAGRWALERGLLEDAVPADWATHGRAAGPIRNSEMLVRLPVPVAAVGFPGGSGSADMERKCRAAGIPVWRVPA